MLAHVLLGAGANKCKGGQGKGLNARKQNSVWCALPPTHTPTLKVGETEERFFSCLMRGFADVTFICVTPVTGCSRPNSDHACLLSEVESLLCVL